MRIFSGDSINKEDLPNPLKSKPYPTWALKKRLKFLLKTGGILRPFLEVRPVWWV
jgi:hypothetical protein